MFDNPEIAINPKNDSTHNSTITAAICLNGEGSIPNNQTIAPKIKRSIREIDFPNRSNKWILIELIPGI
jgi:hypothetical protein